MLSPSVTDISCLLRAQIHTCSTMTTFVQPTTQREARVMNYVNSSDKFFRTIEWPLWAQRLLLKEHKKRNERFNLYYFLIANGLYPGTAIVWSTMTDVVNRRAVSMGYDADALRDVKGLLTKTHAGVIPNGRKRVYDMQLRRPVLM